MKPTPELRCSFRHKSSNDVEWLTQSPADYKPRAAICNECIGVCHYVLSQTVEPEPHILNEMTPEEQFAATAVASWKLAVSRLNQISAGLNPEKMQIQVAPGRNRIYYLIGHLTAVHDRMFPLLGLGERLHPELDEQFLEKPDRTIPDTISPDDLRSMFDTVNAKLTAAIETPPAADWLTKHTAVSEEDFAKDPLRNRLSVLQSRAMHAAFHTGQIRLTQAPA